MAKDKLTGDLFAQTGPELKEKGQKQVIANEQEAWKRAAMDVVRHCAQRFAAITADDVRNRASSIGLPEPHHCNAWGAIFTSAAREGIILRTTNVVESNIPRSHSRALRVWKSCIYRGSAN